mmetsp:Transcript_41660/g.128715  ORF Transcript_41660/g.128715 Transcript_41660/m.128715 type:complete len:233 (+) Transcript_41660:1567-2265(+)
MDPSAAHWSSSHISRIRMGSSASCFAAASRIGVMMPSIASALLMSVCRRAASATSPNSCSGGVRLRADARPCSDLRCLRIPLKASWRPWAIAASASVLVSSARCCHPTIMLSKRSRARSSSMCLPSLAARKRESRSFSDSTSPPSRFDSVSNTSRWRLLSANLNSIRPATCFAMRMHASVDAPAPRLAGIVGVPRVGSIGSAEAEGLPSNEAAPPSPPPPPKPPRVSSTATS